MKKLILTAIAVAGLSVGAFAQGTILFQNYTFGTVLGTVGSNSVATPWVGTINLELFWGPLNDTAAQLLALNTGAVYTTTIPSGAAGHFNDGATITTSGPLGSGSGDVNSVELMIAAWVGPASGYVAALTDAGTTFLGQTAAFGNPTGGGGSPASPPANMVMWTAANSLIVTPSPEPATILLGGLGAAGLLLFRRRK